MTEEYHRSMVFSIHRFIMRLQSILDEIVGDTSIKENAKEEIIKHVLSGRWFSKGLDAFFHNN